MEKYPALRHPAESKLMLSALELDTRDVNDFLDDLCWANPSRCIVLQETVRDLDDPVIWYHMLDYLAYHRWDEETRRDKVGNAVADARIDQAIVETFTQDEPDQGGSIKETILFEALSQPESPIQYTAAYLLGLRGELIAIPVLTDMIDHGHNAWKLQAVKALATMKDRACVQPLMKALVTDRGILHREARRALQNLGPVTKSYWLEALNHPDSHIRWEAARCLAEMGDARAAPTLVEGLYDDNYAVRWATSTVLAYLGSQGVPAILNVLINQKINEPFRQAAYHALHGIALNHNLERVKPLLDVLSNPMLFEKVPSIAQETLFAWDS